MGKFKVYSKILLKQIATKFKNPVVYEIPRCGVSFTKMTKLADEVKGIKIVKEQDTKSTIFKIKSKAPEIVFALVSQMAEFVVPNLNSPSKKDKQKLLELGAYIKKLQPLIKDIELYKEASAFMK
ncbi:MAG: hypothetical protein H8D53_00540 [Bacteroidetes bacterium]|nr:hypothetical protein [Bacteroidota bacterium]MDC0339187.1 hypothetical protein [Flavobacteriales bacterium]